jgi:hypothetical protein
VQLWRSRGPVGAIRERSPLIFYAVVAIVMCVLALGPGGRYGPPSPWRPYTWLLLLPGYDGLRVPARFAMLASLCLAIAAGIAVSFLSRPLGRWRALLAVLVFGGLAVDGMNISVPLIPLPGRIILPGPPQAAVIELPTDDRDISLAAMYRATFHRQPLVNGYSGHTPPYYRVLSLSLWRGDTSGLLFLARGRPLVIIVKDSLDKGNFRKMVEAIPGIQPQGISAAGSMFLLPPQPTPRRPPLGPPLAATPRNAEHYHLELDLGRPQLVMSLTFPLRWHYEELAERLLIESSNDGQNWHEEWRGWTGGLAIEAVLQDPSLAEIQIPLPAVTARYIRIYPAAPWMFDSLKLH